MRRCLRFWRRFRRRGIESNRKSKFAAPISDLIGCSHPPRPAYSEPNTGRRLLWLQGYHFTHETVCGRLGVQFFPMMYFNLRRTILENSMTLVSSVG